LVDRQPGQPEELIEFSTPKGIFISSALITTTTNTSHNLLVVAAGASEEEKEPDPPEPFTYTE
jgi:hypothetical protein